jgi:hypothetical protein
MVEAVRTTASTFAIWAIIAVAMLCLATWLVSIYIADSHQTRMSRLRRQMDAPRPAIGEAGAPAASIPGQRREAGQPEPENVAAARGRHAKPGADYTATDSLETGSRQTDGIRTDFRTDGPLTDVQTDLERDAPTRSDVPAQADAPTRPDLPAQPAQPTPTGRHAMPTQRSGDSDRAERTYAGPDADREGDQDQR